MLDKRRITRRLLDLERYSSRLNDIVPRDYQTYVEIGHEIKAAAERYLQLISDIELEVLMLIFKGKELSIAGDESSLLQRLQPLLGANLINNVKGRRSLRNKLVHAYSDIAFDHEVFELSSDLGDVEKFIERIKKEIA